MAEENAFEWACGAIERATSLDRLQARGTLRLALKASGLDPKEVDGQQMKVVFQRLLPKELESRGIADSTSVCERLADEIGALGLRFAPSAGSAPEDVFTRLDER